MDITAVINQIRQYAPIFQKRVAGAVHPSVVPQNAMGYPSCYVIPTGDDASPNTFGNGLTQQVTESFSVVVALQADSDQSDRRGQSAVQMADTIRTQLFSAILNWRYDPVESPQGIEYAGMTVSDYDNARLFLEYHFKNVRTITEADGFQEVYPDLEDIEITVEDEDTGATVNASVTLPIE